jgi:hypothetical protein
MNKTRKHSGNGGGVKNFFKSLKNKVKTKGKSIKKSWNNFGRNINTKDIVNRYYYRNFQTAPQEDKEKLYKFWINATRRMGNNTKSLFQMYRNEKTKNKNVNYKKFLEPIKNARIENEASYRNIPNLKNQIKNANFTNLEIADLFSRLERIKQTNKNGVKRHMNFVKSIKNRKAKQDNHRRGSSNLRNKAQVGMEIGKILF